MKNLVVKNMAGLAVHEKQWNELARRAPQRSPMLTFAWNVAYFEHRLLPGETWLCIFCYKDDTMVGVLPLLSSRRRHLLFVRSILRTPHDPHTRSVDLLVAPGTEKEVIPRLLKAAVAEFPRRFCLFILPIPGTSPTLDVVRKDRSIGSHVLCHFRDLGSFLRIDRPFAEYRSSLSSNFRSNLNKARNKLKKLAGVELEILFGDTARGDELQRFIRVEATSWKGKQGSAILCSPSLVKFYTSLMQRLADADMVLWCFLVAEGKTIAGNLCCLLERTIVVWKLGYDPEYRRCSPGGLLFEELVKYACEADGIEEINLMTDQPWYDDWQMEKRAYYEVRIVRSSLLPLLLDYYPQKLRNSLKQKPWLVRAYRFIRNALRRSRES